VVDIGEGEDSSTALASAAGISMRREEEREALFDVEWRWLPAFDDCGDGAGAESEVDIVTELG
jgi:hypothetical protein